MILLYFFYVLWYSFMGISSLPYKGGKPMDGIFLLEKVVFHSLAVQAGIDCESINRGHFLQEVYFVLHWLNIGECTEGLPCKDTVT